MELEVDDGGGEDRHRTDAGGDVPGISGISVTTHPCDVTPRRDRRNRTEPCNRHLDRQRQPRGKTLGGDVADDLSDRATVPVDHDANHRIRDISAGLLKLAVRGLYPASTLQLQKQSGG